MLHLLVSLILIQRPLTFMLQSSGAAVTASWTANPPSDNVTVYRLYYGTASKTYTTTIDISAPLTSVVVPNLSVKTTYYFAIQARVSDALVSALSPEVSITIPQSNPCLDTGGNNVVQLRVLSFTSSLAANGLGQLLWTITSASRIVNITATLNGMPFSVMDGSDSKTVDFTNSAGINFKAPSTSGKYTLVVSAVDVNGCKADTSSVTRIVNVP